ncbi:alpha/beta fold hydrolase [Streptomyces sp. NPDC005141]
MTEPIQTVAAVSGVSYAYRRFGNSETSALPLVFLQCYRGNLDLWDPILVDSIAAQREVILVDNAGVGGSTGRVPSTVQEMAVHAVEFLDALGVRRYDLLGFSMGGFVAQEMALIRPHEIRRIVLAGTAPQGGNNFHGWRGALLEAALREAQDAEDLFTLFFERTETSRSLGADYLKRISSRDREPDRSTDLAARDAQLSAIAGWGVPDESRLSRLAAITQPVLAANGDNDVMLPTENTYLFAKHLPNVRVSIYPDAAHGFLFQYPAEFAAEVNVFLGR